MGYGPFSDRGEVLFPTHSCIYRQGASTDGLQSQEANEALKRQRQTTNQRITSAAAPPKRLR